MRNLSALFVTLLVLQGCISPGESNQKTESRNSPKGVAVDYAKGFTVQKTDKTIYIDVLNPWQNADGIQYTYRLVSKPEKKSEAISDTIEITVPVKRIVCMSTSHVAFIDALNSSDRIVGISGAGFVTSAAVAKRVSNGAISEVGYGSSMNYELITQLRPDIILCYGVGEESVGYLNKLKELGHKLMFIGDYLENDPLGKAEWIKVFGYLLGSEKKADSLFRTIVQSYNRVKQKAKQYTTRPRIFLNLPFKDIWYFPTRSSYFVKLIADAGGEYPYSPPGTGTVFSTGIERAYEIGLQCDIWINPGMASSMDDIKNTDTRFVQLPAYRNGRVYNNNKRSNSAGGNDFWESGTLNPHLILQDLITIFHQPEKSDSSLYYYRKLK